VLSGVVGGAGQGAAEDCAVARGLKFHSRRAGVTCRAKNKDSLISGGRKQCAAWGGGGRVFWLVL